MFPAVDGLKWWIVIADGVRGGYLCWWKYYLFSCFSPIFRGNHAAGHPEIISFVLVFDGRCFVRLTAAYQTCLMRACLPRSLSGLYQLFDLCLIKHVLTIWTHNSTLACLVTNNVWWCLVAKHFSYVQGPVSQKPRKVFGPVKPFLDHLYLKTEKCVHLKLLVWRKPPFIFRIGE